MEEMYKPEHGECNCNVYITVNCCKDEKKPCYDREKECKECNVYITVNCGKEEKRPCYNEK